MSTIRPLRKLLKLTQKKATVVVIGALAKHHCEYAGWPFLISATCKGKDATRHAELLQTILQSCSQEKGVIMGKVYCVTSDSEAR